MTYLVFPNENEPIISCQSAIMCPICKLGQTSFLFQKLYKGLNLLHSGIESIPLNFRKCHVCGIVFSVPLSKEAMQACFAWYEDIYHKEAQVEARTPCNPINQIRYAEWLRLLEPYRKTGKLFETGFGRGEFLMTASKFGWLCSGNEASFNACESVRRFGATVYCTDIGSVDIVGDQDIVVSMGVIEHVPDPHVQFQNYYRLLRSGGAVFITTPNYNSLARLLLGPQCRILDVEHLFYFTPKTISRLLRMSGFRIVKCWSKNVNIPEILKGFLPIYQGREAVRTANQEFRQMLEFNGILKQFKAFVNWCISQSGVGEELYVIAVKSGGELPDIYNDHRNTETESKKG